MIFEEDLAVVDVGGDVGGGTEGERGDWQLQVGGVGVTSNVVVVESRHVKFGIGSIGRMVEVVVLVGCV